MSPGQPTPRRPIRGFVRSVALLVLAVILAGCDDTFDPYLDSDLELSIMGYLDASADTQWVRVTPIRESIFTSSAPLNVQVTIERISDGKTTALRDSIFTFKTALIEDAPDQFAHAFWAREKVSYGSSYRIKVAPPGVAPSEATVAIPPNYPVVIRSGPNNRIAVRVAIEHLALVEVHCSAGGAKTVSAPMLLAPASGGVFDIVVTRFLFTDGSSCPVPLTKVSIVSSGAPWPSGSAASSAALNNISRPSNISNAVGFLGGVVTKLLPWETCVLVPTTPAPCDLTFTERSAHLEGRVLDALCGQPPDSSEITLTEVRSPPARQWSVGAGRGGNYKLDLLDPDIRYAVRVVSPDTTIKPPIVLKYGVLQDTVTFKAGERISRDVLLPRRVSCSTL